MTKKLIKKERLENIKKIIIEELVILKAKEIKKWNNVKKIHEEINDIMINGCRGLRNKYITELLKDYTDKVNSQELDKTIKITYA